MPKGKTTGLKSFIKEIEKLGFSYKNGWICDNRKFDLYMQIANEEVAMILIMQYNDDYGFEAFVNATGSLEIMKTLDAIKERFNL